MKVNSLLLRFIGSWFFTSSLFLFKNINKIETILTKNYILNVSHLQYIFIISFVFFGLTLIDKIYRNNFYDILITISFGLIYGCVLCLKTNNLYVCLGFIIIFIFVLKIVFNTYPKVVSGFLLDKKSCIIYISTIATLWILFVSVLTILRYLTFRAPCYDMGIFSQMFYYMKKCFVPFTTCERDVLMTHFNIHMSPAFYIYLPVYIIFPYPVTLLILQALTVASGVIPLYLICKNRKLSRTIIFLICCLYFLYPSNAGGCFYDFHENVFLAPFVLWLLYGIDKDKNVLIIVFSILTFMVKEDAPIYVACIGLFVFFNNKKYKQGLCLFLASVLYFGVAIFYLSNYGDGAMTGRFDNFIEEGKGITSIISMIIMNPAYTISQIITPEKIEFIIYMLAPFFMIIVISKNIWNYILIIPFFVINLLSDNPYQHSIYYQYTFGAMAMLFYIFVKNLQRFSKVKQKKICLYSIIITTMLFLTALGDKFKYIDYYIDDKPLYKDIENSLDIIPKNASIEATTCLVTYLSNRDYIYKFKDGNKNCQYVAIDLIYESSKNLYEDKKEELLKLGYKEILFKIDKVVILKK